MRYQEVLNEYGYDEHIKGKKAELAKNMAQDPDAALGEDELKEGVEEEEVKER